MEGGGRRVVWLLKKEKQGTAGFFLKYKAI